MADTDIKTGASVDPAEVERFSRLAAEWWDPRGKFRPLHRFNPVRLGYVRDAVIGHFGRDGSAGRPFEGLRLLDIGCGGGLLSEPMARLGAQVMAIDPSDTNIAVAKLHAEQSGLDIDYRATTVENLAATKAAFDIVLCMEVVEHVADVPSFLATIASLVRPGGLLALSTINRTLKAYALAIIGAEYVLRWLPRGTHAYDKLVRPDEIIEPLERAGLGVVETTGVAYDPINDRWRLARDTDVNYMVLAQRSS